MKKIKTYVVKRPCGKIVAIEWNTKEGMKEFVKTWENKEGYILEVLNETPEISSQEWSCDYFCACEFKLLKKE